MNFLLLLFSELVIIYFKLSWRNLFNTFRRTVPFNRISTAPIAIESVLMMEYMLTELIRSFLNRNGPARPSAAGRSRPPGSSRGGGHGGRKRSAVT